MRSHRHLDQVGPLISLRSSLVFLGAALLVVPGSAQNEDPLAARSKGASGAPVTVYEMADFQCPACRMFTVTVLPTIEREFVQTGKVRWVFINLPLTSIHPNAMAAAEVAMCAARQGGPGRGRFWQTHDALYQQQDDWAKLAQPRAELIKIAQRAGVDRGKLVACLNGGDARKEVEADAQRATRTGARATPSFYIEGGLLEGAPYTPDPMRHLLDSIYAVRTSATKPK
ncbi:MAG TPA: thioredoxin domain-containing protein [Gemmatimonadales bacterium]|nr:thioredoxin domain-containing protein [Gemmatimonadales bacterium]